MVLLVPVATKSTSFDEQVVERKSQLTSRSKITTCTKRYQTKTQHQRFTSSKRIRQHHDCLDLTPSTMVPSSGRTTCLNDEEYCSTFNREDITKRRRRIRGTYKSSRPLLDLMVCFGMLSLVLLVQRFVSEVVVVEAISPNPVGSYAAVSYWTNDGNDGSNYTRQVNDVWSRMVGTADNPVEESVLGYPIIFHDYSKEEFPPPEVVLPPPPEEVSPPPPTLPPATAPTLPPEVAPTLPPEGSPTLPPEGSPTLPPVDAPTLPPVDAPTLPPEGSPTLPPDEDEPEPVPEVPVPPDQPEPEPVPEGIPGEAEISNPDNFIFDGPDDAFPSLNNEGPLLSLPEGIPPELLGGNSGGRRRDRERERERRLQEGSQVNGEGLLAQYEYVKFDSKTGAMIPSGVAVIKGIDPPRGMFPKHVMPIPIPTGPGNQQPQIITNTTNSTEVDREESDVDAGLGDAVTGSGGGTTLTSSLPVTSSTTPLYLAPPLEIAVTGGSTGGNTRRERMLEKLRRNMLYYEEDDADDVRAPTNKARTSAYALLETQADELINAPIPVGGDTNIPPPSTTKNNNDGKFPLLVVPMLFANHQYPATVAEGIPDHIAAAYGRSDSPNDRWVPTQSQLDTLFNGKTAGDNEIDVGTGSLRSFMEQLSHGNVLLEAQVLDWIPLRYNESHYASRQRGYGTKSKIDEAIVEALDYLDMDYHLDNPDVKDPINLKQYDLDNDGILDPGHILFLHSGYSAECGGIAEDRAYYMDRIWSHTSLLLKSPRQQVSKEERIYIRGDTGAGWTSTPQLNKDTGVYDVESVVRIPCYSIVSAAHGIHFFRKPLEERIVRVGVLAHELISQMLLGLMEQQDVGQDSSSGVDVATFTRSNAGNWDFTSLGGEGAWGFGAGDQTCVSPLNPLTRIHLGWLQPQQVHEITFNDVKTARSSYYDQIPLEISTNGTSIPSSSSSNTYDESDGYRITLKPTTLKNAIVYKVSDGLAEGEYLLLEYRRRRGPDDIYSHDCVGSSCGDELLQEEEEGGDYIDGMGLDGCLPIIGGLAIWHVMETSSQGGGGRNVTVRLLQSDQSRDLERGFNTGDSGDLFTPHAMGINDEGATHLFIAPTGKVLTFQNEMVDGQLQVVEDPMAPSKFMTEMGIALDLMDTNKNSNSQPPPPVETNGEFNTTGDEIIMDFDENTNIIEPTVVGVWIRNIAYQGPKQEEMTFQIKFESFEEGGGLDYIDGDGDGIYHEGNVTDVTPEPAPSPTITTAGGGSSPTNSPTLHPTEAPAPSRPPRTAAPVPIPTPSIKRACSPDDKDMALFQVLVTTDLKGEDTWWELNDVKRGPTLWHMEGPYDTGISKQYNFQACLPKRTCWSWTLHDKSGDGLNKGDGGFYRLTWDGQLLDRSTNTIDGRSPEFYEYGVDFGDGCMNEISNWFVEEQYKPEVPMNLIGDMQASGIMFNIHSPMDWPSRDDGGQSFMVLHFRKIHLAEVVPGANENRKISLNIYTKNGSYEGYETNKNAWELCQTLNNISPMGFQQWTHTVDGGFNQSRSNRGLGGIMIAKGTTQAFYIEVFDPVPPDAQDKISDSIVPFQRNDVIYVNDCIGRVDMKQKGTPNQIDMRFANFIDVYSGTMVLPNFGGISQATKKSSNGDSTACVEVLFKLNQMTVLQPNENGEYPLVGEDRIDGATDTPDDWMLARDEYYQYDEALYYNQVPPTAFDPTSYGIMDGTTSMEGDGEGSFMMETAQDMMPGGSGFDISRGAGADFNFVQQDENELLLSSSSAAAAKAKDSPNYFGLVVANGLKAQLIATSGQMIPLQTNNVPLPINKNNVPPVFHSNPSGGTCIPLYNITKVQEHTNERRRRQNEGVGVVGQTSPPPQGRESSSSPPPYYYDEMEESTDDGSTSFLSGDDFLIGWAYVSNSESEHLDDNTKGGVGTLIFDIDGNLVDYNMMLQGTNNNAGGGMTPWGTWLSCEEDGNVGFVYEVDVQQMAAPRLLHHLHNQKKNNQGDEEYFSGRETFEISTDFDDRMEDDEEMTTTTTSTTCLGEGGGNFHSVAYDARSFNALACTSSAVEQNEGDDDDSAMKNCHVDFYVSVDTEWSVIRKYTPNPQLIRDSYLNGGSTLTILSKEPNQSFEESCTHKRNGPLLYIKIESSSSTVPTNNTTNDDDADDDDENDEDVLAKGTFQWTESRQEAQLSWSTLEFPFTEQILVQDGNLYVRSKVVPNTMLIFNLDNLTWKKQPLSNVLDSIYQYQVYSNEQANRGPFLSSKWRSWHHWQPNEALDGLATTSTESTTSSSNNGQDQIAVHDLMFYTQDGGSISYDSSKKTNEKEEEEEESMKLPGVYARDETIGGILLPLMVVKKNSMYYNYFCGTGTATDASSSCRSTMKLSGLALSPDQKHLYVAFQHPGHVWEITREDGQTFKGQVLDMSTRSGSFDVAALPMNYARENSTSSNDPPTNSGNSTSTVTSGPSSSSSQQYHHRRRRDMRRHLLAGSSGLRAATTTTSRM